MALGDNGQCVSDRILDISKDTVMVPGHMIPAFCVNAAFQRGKQREFLIHTWGGLGDQICAEPAIRFGMEQMPNVRFSLYSEFPELFSHLNFHEVFDAKKVKPNFENYMVFQSITNPQHLMWQFFSHMLTHCVDFVSLCMWRCQMPIASKQIQLPDFSLENWGVENFLLVNGILRERDRTVIVHAGKHWQSKTFPETWWNSVIHYLKEDGIKVVLIGKKVDENVGYVDVFSEGCIDTRDNLSIREWVYLLKNCKYLLTNDSSPIHAAAAGNAFIGYVATCKHPDYITHYRHGTFGWNMKNFGKDGIWNHIDHSPCQEQTVEVERLPDGLLEKILPCPQDVAKYYSEMIAVRED
jgi:ADP-heptose:LPS heptosyltransferase